MKERVESTHGYDDGIDLAKILKPLWKNKLLIISATIIAVIMAGLISLFLLSPEYESRANITVNLPRSYTTRYGDYTLPAITNQQYMDMIKHDIVLKRTLEDIKTDIDITKSDLRDSINISSTQTGNDKTNYNVAVRRDDPDDAMQIAHALYENYVTYVDAVVREKTLLYYYDRFTTGIETSQISLSYENESLKNNLELLEGMQKFINIDEIWDTIPSIGEVMIIESITNPEYEKLQEDILVKKQTINDLENTIRQNKENIEQIRAERNIVGDYYETGELDTEETTIINVVKRHITQVTAISSGKKVGPSHSRNVALGALLGIVLSSLGVLIKHYVREKLM